MTGVTPEAAETNMKVGRTASKEVRRRQLIDATIKSIAQYGISGTTMTTVTGFAGLSIGIVNFHFKNKKTLFKETLRFLAEEHRDHWRKFERDADLSAEAKLKAIADAHFHPDICNRTKLTVWFGFYGEAAYRASYREIMSKIDEERWETSKRLCAEIIEEGKYEQTVAKDVADTLEGLYDGFWLNILIYPEEFPREDARQRLHEYFAVTFPRHFDHPGNPTCKG